jgi:hypothetical protein
MATIKNLTRRPVSLRLNSGTTLHLSPGTTSPKIDDVEVQSNAEMQKLQDRRVIELSEIDVTAEEPAAAVETSSAKSGRSRK